MKMQAALIGALALGLAACGGEAEPAQNVETEMDMSGSGGGDLETTNLPIDANASAVDQAVDSAGQEAGLDNALDSAANSLENTVE